MTEQLTFEAIAKLRADIPTGLWVVLDHREQMFVLHLLADPAMHRGKAAIAAGYPARRAKQAAHEALQKPTVKGALDAAMAQRAKRVSLTADWVLDRLRENVERSMQVEPVRDHDGNAIGEYAYQGSVANGALTLIGKHLGMFADRLRVAVDDPDAFAQQLKALPKAERQAFILKMLAGK